MHRFQLVFSIPCRASRAKSFSPYSATGISVVGYCRLACASTILRHYQRHRRRRRWHLLSGSGSGSSTAAIVGLGIISSPLPVSPLLCLLYHSPLPLSLSLCLARSACATAAAAVRAYYWCAENVCVIAMLTFVFFAHLSATGAGGQAAGLGHAHCRPLSFRLSFVLVALRGDSENPQSKCIY